jgi:hypothetical protein
MNEDLMEYTDEDNGCDCLERLRPQLLMMQISLLCIALVLILPWVIYWLHLLWR